MPVSLFGSFFAKLIEHLPEGEQEQKLALAFEALDELGSEPLVLSKAELNAVRATLRELREQLRRDSE